MFRIWKDKYLGFGFSFVGSCISRDQSEQYEMLAKSKEETKYLFG